MRTIVIGDLHGDFLGLAAILRETGAIDANDERVPGTTVIQLGDLIHGGNPRGVPRPGVDDATCAELALAACDTILIGNHELPHLWPYANFPVFGGQRPMSDHLKAILRAAYRDGQIVPAYAHERWLLTHAGVHSSLHAFYAETAKEAARKLCDLFQRRLDGPKGPTLIDGVGPLRGGSDRLGGMFWCDWQELIDAPHGMAYPQIVGHTPQDGGYAQHGDSWCVDANAALSGRVSALVQDEAGGEWRPVVVTN